jgi:hypothetical protein
MNRVANVAVRISGRTGLTKRESFFEEQAPKREDIMAIECQTGDKFPPRRAF